MAGVWAGRDLVSPGQRVRATAEAVRAAWLDALAAHLPGAKVLELFAGSGALGLEALSRGAACADFVESGAAAMHALKANVAALRLRPPRPGVSPTAKRKAVRILKRDAIPLSRELAAGAYDLAFADPPYGSAKLDLVVARWREVPFARVLGVEHAASHVLPEGGWRLEAGDTVVTIYGLQIVGRQQVTLPAKAAEPGGSEKRRRRRSRGT